MKETPNFIANINFICYRMETLDLEKNLKNVDINQFEIYNMFVLKEYFPFLFFFVEFRCNIKCILNNNLTKGNKRIFPRKNVIVRFDNFIDWTNVAVKQIEAHDRMWKGVKYQWDSMNTIKDH